MLIRVGLLSLLLIVLLAACGAPEYVPDADTLAARDAEEYEYSIIRDWILFGLMCVALVVLFIVLVLFIWQMKSVAYRKQNAKAAYAEAVAWKEGLVTMSPGQILAKDGTLYSADYATLEDTAPPPMVTYQPPHKDTNTGKLMKFVLDIKRMVGWDTTRIPHYTEWEAKLGDEERMSGEEWVTLTNEMVVMGLLEPKRPGVPTVIKDGQTLSWVFHRLRAPLPTGAEPSEQLPE